MHLNMNTGKTEYSSWNEWYRETEKYITFSHPPKSRSDPRSHETILRPPFPELKNAARKYL